MSISTMSTIAFFGATGGCAGYCLAAALNAGHRCIALARTPSKLTASLEAKGVSADSLTMLSIVKGDVKVRSTVRDALQIDGRVVDIVVSGIGSLPKLQWSLMQPVGLVDPTLCEDAVSSALDALSSMKNYKKPLFIVLSTTGIPFPGAPRDVPLAYYALYHWLLSAPHKDKAKMEVNLRRAMSLAADERPIRGYVLAKPTLLMDGPPKGIQNVRAGGEEKPALGYSIRRGDVGQWIYEKLVAQEPATEWMSKAVSLTY